MTASQIDKARDLASSHMSRRDEGDPESLEFQHVNTLPEGGYNVPDDRHRTEPGWFHFAIIQPNRLGSTTYLSVKPESDEVRSSVIGE